MERGYCETKLSCRPEDSPWTAFDGRDDDDNLFKTRGWTPERFINREEPVVEFPLPLRGRSDVLTLEEACALLGVICDLAGRAGKVGAFAINDFSCEANAYSELGTLVAGIDKDDVPYIEILIERVKMGLRDVGGTEIKPPAINGPSSETSTATPSPPQHPATTNQLMLEMLQKNHEASGWPSTKWAKAVKRSRSTVTDTDTWKTLEVARLQAKADRMKDRRRKPKASDQKRN